MKPLTPRMIDVLRTAAARADGNPCPTHGLRGAAQTATLDALEARGLIARDPRPPHAPPEPAWFYCPLRITDAGRRVVAENS